MARGHTVVLSSSALTVQVEPVARFLGIENMLSNKFETDERRAAHRRGADADHLGARQGQRGADVRRRERHRPDEELLLRRRRRGRRADVPGRQSAADQPRGQAGRRCRQTRLAGAAVLQPQRQQSRFRSCAPLAGVGVDGAGRGGRRRARPADPQPAHAASTSSPRRSAAAAGGHRRQPQRARRGEPDRAAARRCSSSTTATRPTRSSPAALVSDNFTSVGKKELESDPIVGTMGKMMDAAFIDRDDPKAAVETLHKVEELARKGLSILIAPEGTRLDTTEVGPFKKGPFRIAMAAGIPIVPDRHPQRRGHRRPRLDARSTPARWTSRCSRRFRSTTGPLRTCRDRIAEVRQLYLDTLKDWPRRRAARRRAGSYAREEGAGEEGAAAKKAPAKKAAAKKAPRRRLPAKKVSQPRRRAGQRRVGREARDRRRWRASPPTDDALVLASVSSTGRAGAAERLAATASGASIPTPRSRCSSCPPRTIRRPASLARLVEELEADEDRSVVPVRVFWVPGGLPTRSKVVGAALRPRHLPSAGDPAAPHPAQGPVPRPGGGRRAGEGLRAAPAVERHHRRRKPARIRAIRHPPRQPGDRTRRAAAARAGVQVAAAGQAGDAGVGAVSRGPREDSRRDRRDRPGRCSTNSPPGGVGSPST